MSDAVIERHFKQTPDMVFRFLSQSDHILQWFGPDKGSVPDYSLNLGELGPWHAKMLGSNGQKYHVSGEVTSVDEPNFIEFSWGWSDEDGNRGHESNVRFEVSVADQGGTNFKLTHKDLPDEESAQNHVLGWTSNLERLEKLVN